MEQGNGTIHECFRAAQTESFVENEQYVVPFDQLYAENQAYICGLEEEVEEEVQFEHDGDVEFIE